MKKLLAILFCVLFLACNPQPDNKDPLKLVRVTLEYTDSPMNGDFGHQVSYYFDMDNVICYVMGHNGWLIPVSFRECYIIYQRYIEPNEKSPEKE